MRFSLRSMLLGTTLAIIASVALYRSGHVGGERYWNAWTVRVGRLSVNLCFFDELRRNSPNMWSVNYVDWWRYPDAPEHMTKTYRLWGRRSEAGSVVLCSYPTLEPIQ